MAMNVNYLDKYMDGFYTKRKIDNFMARYRYPGLKFNYENGDLATNAIPKFYGKMFEHMNLVREHNTHDSSESYVFREHSATATITL